MNCKAYTPFKCRIDEEVNDTLQWAAMDWDIEVLYLLVGDRINNSYDELEELRVKHAIYWPSKPIYDYLSESLSAICANPDWRFFDKLIDEGKVNHKNFIGTYHRHPDGHTPMPGFGPKGDIGVFNFLQNRFGIRLIHLINSPECLTFHNAFITPFPDESPNYNLYKYVEWGFIDIEI